MTQAIDSPSFARGTTPTRVDIPALPAWAVRRSRLSDRLDLGASSLLTLVTGPTGSGKTLGVASWATQVEGVGALIWLSLAGAGADPDCFWINLREGLLKAGMRELVPSGRAERHSLRALAELGVAARRSGPWVVVLDDYPAGTAGRLGRELHVVLHHARRAMRLIVISRGDPAIETHRQHAAGELTRITASDLDMDAGEVAAVLRTHRVDASEVTARVVQRHTGGWPCGVRLAAEALQGAATIETALESADCFSVDYLASEVLAKSPAGVRELLVRTSVVDEVSPDLARAVLGVRAEPALKAVADNGWVDVRRDGSFRCHRLLQAAALAQLGQRTAPVAADIRLRAARWYADRDDQSTAIALAVAAKDWRWVARALVEFHAVPRILAGGPLTGVIDAALALDQVRDAEPILQAAVALSQGNPAAASAALSKVSTTRTATSRADRLSDAFVRLALSRITGQPADEEHISASARQLIGQLPREDHTEFSSVLDGLLGALAMGKGQIHEAATRLRHGANIATDPSAPNALPSAGALDCQGQLALLEAFRGNLNAGYEQAASVLEHGAGAAPGAAHAQLATAWIHLERARPAPARHHLEQVQLATLDQAEPWLAVAHQIVQARLLVLRGQPEAALRLLVPAVREAQGSKYSGKWTADLLTITLAETYLVAGEPRRVLGHLTPIPANSAPEARVLVASALMDLGDTERARAALHQDSGEFGGAPLGVQIEAWLVEARIAQRSGHARQTHLIVERALRTAGAETLRRPFAHRSAWLSAIVDRDSTLRRTHGGFVAGVRPAAFRQVGRATTPHEPDPLLVEPLTERESRVLVLLSDVCSTEEIAQELVVSVNTVKTHVAAILRKLCVNRRHEAVRRGRDLGLC